MISSQLLASAVEIPGFGDYSMTRNASLVHFILQAITHAYKRPAKPLNQQVPASVSGLLLPLAVMMVVCGQFHRYLSIVPHLICAVVPRGLEHVRHGLHLVGTLS